MYSEGNALDYTPTTDKTAGDIVAVGSGRIGVAINDIAAGKLGALDVRGVHSLPKVNGAVNLWAFLYYDEDGNPQDGVAGTGALTTVSGGNIPAGIAVAPAEAADARVYCLLFGGPAITNTIHQALSYAIADPGNAGAIPVTDSGVCPLVTAGAETRTMDVPAYEGEEILLPFRTDGGDCVLAVATTVNQAGNNRVTFNDAGDWIKFVAIKIGANLRWRIAASEGVTLSTV